MLITQLDKFEGRLFVPAPHNSVESIEGAEGHLDAAMTSPLSCRSCRSVRELYLSI
jgi:hypothetical protein